MHGFISINKPAGISSFQATRAAAKALGVKKAGHAGTLDPFATGVLPVAVGEATKAVRYLHLAEKTYIATIRFGVLTDTLDVTGNVIETRETQGLEMGALQAVLPRFTGEIEQRPPIYSAVKVRGRRSYEAARSGEPEEPPPRKVTVNGISVKSFEPPLAVVEVRCGAGTYIRSLARDIGEAMGCCAVLQDLVRTRYGPFSIETSCPPERASAGLLVPTAAALSHLARIPIAPEVEKDVRNGVKPDAEFFKRHGLACPAPGSSAIMTDREGLLVAVLKAKDGGEAEYQRVFNEKARA